MASSSVNNAVQALQRRHAAERTALKAATDAVAVVRRAQLRRSEELARLDEAVEQADSGADMGLAVLASLVGADVAAQLLQEPVARVRLGQQRAPVDEVTATLGELTEGVAVAPRRGRPRGGSNAERVRGFAVPVVTDSGGSQPSVVGLDAGGAGFSEGR